MASLAEGHFLTHSMSGSIAPGTKGGKPDTGCTRWWVTGLAKVTKCSWPSTEDSTLNPAPGWSEH